MPLRYGTVYIRGRDIYEAIQKVMDIVDIGGLCYVGKYSYYSLEKPQRISETEYRIRMLSAGGYYVEVSIKKVGKKVFMVDVYGADISLRADQDRLGACIVRELKKKEYEE